VPRDQHDPPVDGADVLIGDDPLTRYRRAQARLRQLFAPFTRTECPRCPTPCCRRPVAVTPFDVVLAEELGHRLPAGVEAAGDNLEVQLGLIPVPTLASDGPPCDFLGPHGCSFPPDLVPFGCAAYICPYMEAWYTPDQLAELRSGVDELKQAHAELHAVLHAGGV
jgi:hypothetical protein